MFRSRRVGRGLSAPYAPPLDNASAPIDAVAENDYSTDPWSVPYDLSAAAAALRTAQSNAAVDVALAAKGYHQCDPPYGEVCAGQRRRNADRSRVGRRLQCAAAGLRRRRCFAHRGDLGRLQQFARTPHDPRHLAGLDGLSRRRFSASTRGAPTPPPSASPPTAPKSNSSTPAPAPSPSTVPSTTRQRPSTARTPPIRSSTPSLTT